MSMNFYLIKYIDNSITIGRYANEKFQIIKKNGEHAQEYHEEYFWEWFKDKICYKDEKLSFAVITDEDSFIFPEDINIAEVHELEDNQKVQEEISKYFTLIYTPSISNNINHVSKSPQPTVTNNNIYTATPEDFNNNIEVDEIVEPQQVIVEPVIEQQVPVTFNLKEEMKKLTPEELIEIYFGDEIEFNIIGNKLIDSIDKVMFAGFDRIDKKIMDEREVVKFSDYI